MFMYSVLAKGFPGKKNGYLLPDIFHKEGSFQGVAFS